MTKAEIRFHRADKLYRGAVRMFFGFAFVMLAVVVVQMATLQSDFANAQTAELKRQEAARVESRARLNKALEETNKQQVVTQNYVRCVASLLLVPVPERSAEKLDACGIPGVTDPENIGNQSTTQNNPVTQQQQYTAPTPYQQPVATKPAPNEPATSGGAPPESSGGEGSGGNDGNNDGSQTILDRLPLIGGLLRAIGL
jgi:hypothetical protein